MFRNFSKRLALVVFYTSESEVSADSEDEAPEDAAAGTGNGNGGVSDPWAPKAATTSFEVLRRMSVFKASLVTIFHSKSCKPKL